jgi:hypothetical protein
MTLEAVKPILEAELKGAKTVAKKLPEGGR